MAMALDDTEAKRTIWARTAAQHLVHGVLTAIERYPAGDRNMLLREIARQAVWHMQDLATRLDAWPATWMLKIFGSHIRSTMNRQGDEKERGDRDRAQRLSDRAD